MFLLEYKVEKCSVSYKSIAHRIHGMHDILAKTRSCYNHKSQAPRKFKQKIIIILKKHSKKEVNRLHRHHRSLRHLHLQQVRLRVLLMPVLLLVLLLTQMNQIPA